MINEQDYKIEENYSDLENYLLMENWDATTGQYLLCGWHPKTPRQIDGVTDAEHDFLLSLNNKIYLFNRNTLDANESEGRQAVNHYARVINRWLGCSHPEITRGLPKYEVAYFIDWAEKQKIDIPWLMWAKAKNLLPQKNRKRTISDSKELATKTKNSYLKTIHALSDALCNGLTGKVHKDAETVLAALDSKGVTHPLIAKTLAGYLTEAKKIDDNQ